MADPREHDPDIDNDYDEEADSDFLADDGDVADRASSSENEATEGVADQRPMKRRKTRNAPQPATELGELDSGDEATIKEQDKARRRRKKKGEEVEDEGDISEGWRARTRAMRERENDERKRNKLATSKGSTIDVDKIWEEINKSVLLPLPRMEQYEADGKMQSTHSGSDASSGAEVLTNKNNVVSDVGEMITIKRTYKFAGEFHTEEKSVARSSAEAKLWLSQQAGKEQSTTQPRNQTVLRPVRKISRFDPNHSNLAAFKKNWSAGNTGHSVKGPKLNVVEKSKMDWAVHVDAEGLKEELDEHARAKEGYLNRMDFLGEVEQRREAEARAARLKT